MLFKNLLLVNAILFVPFGIGFVFIPSTLLSLYGVNPVLLSIIMFTETPHQHLIVLAS
ncbi:MAG: hypothetical protein ACK2UR_19385 [Candidatus Promineifilaceae bacterium]